MPVARIVGGIGRVLITVGLLMLLFVAYQLWGTGLAEARAQDELREDLEAALATTTTTTTTVREPTRSTTTTSTSTTTTVPPPPVVQGEALAVIRIPRIGVDKAVVEGVSVDDLEKGPGHYPGTPLPGQPGNVAIAGHRTTYGAPFGELGELQEGDEILVTTRQGDFRYVVDRITIVSPSQVEVLDQSEEPRITLTTCHPKYSARQRLIVSGVLAGEPLPAPDPTVPETFEELPDEEEAGDETGDEEDETEAGGSEDDPVMAEPAASLDDPSLAGDPSARGPAAAWGAATALIALVAWLVGKRWRRWPAYLLGLPLGVVTLFLCFEQVARLLPANI